MTTGSITPQRLPRTMKTINKLPKPLVKRLREDGADIRKPKENSEQRIGTSLGFALMSTVVFSLIWGMMFCILKDKTPVVDGIAIGIVTFILVFWGTFDMWIAYVVDNQVWIYRDRMPPRRAYCLTQG